MAQFGVEVVQDQLWSMVSHASAKFELVAEFDIRDAEGGSGAMREV